MGDLTDHLQEFATHGRGCQPVGIRDRADLSHTGPAHLELIQDCLSCPRGDALKSKRLIQLHGTPYELTMSLNSVLETLADQGLDTGFLWDLSSHPPLRQWRASTHVS